MSVELGHFSIDVGKGDPLTPGKILPVRSDSPGMVKLMYQGSELGTGELLSVDGKMAIRILKNWNN